MKLNRYTRQEAGKPEVHNQHSPLSHDLLVGCNEAAVFGHHLLATLQHLRRKHLADRVVRNRDILANGEDFVKQLRSGSHEENDCPE